MIIASVVIAVFLLFGLTAFVGAPYIPAHRRAVETALKLLDLNKDDIIVDLGSGDGVVLKMAAEQGLRAWGYEINPILCIVAWLRCLRYSGRVMIRWRDFWHTNLPTETKAVFIFAAGPYMKRLTRKLEQEARRHERPLYVASYGFELVGHNALKRDAGVCIYRLSDKAVDSIRT